MDIASTTIDAKIVVAIIVSFCLEAERSSVEGPMCAGEQNQGAIFYDRSYLFDLVYDALSL